MGTPLKLGFIGGGVNSAVGHVHEIACRMDHRFHLQAGCFSRHADINLKTGAAYAIDPARVYASIDDMLAKEKGRLDAVVVLTPPDQHTTQIIKALQNGFAVISEKPLAVSSTEIAQIQATLADTHGFLAVTYNYLAYPMMRELAHMIASGKLGAIRQIMLEMPQEGFLRLHTDTNEPYVPQEWRLHDYNGVSTVSLDLCAHLHMFVNFLTREAPLKVSGIGGTMGNFDQLVDHGMGIARYTNDLAVNFWFGKTSLGFRNGLRVRVYGTEGSAEWLQETPEVMKMADRYGHHYTFDRAHPDARVSNQERYTRFKAGHPAGFIEAFANYYADIADALLAHKQNGRHDNPLVAGISEADEGLRLLEALAQAMKTDTWVDIKPTPQQQTHKKRSAAQ